MALQLAGKRHQSVPLLEEIFQNKESVDYYVLLKATLTHLELAITQKDYQTVKTILDYFETIDKYVGIARPTPLNLTSDSEEGSEASHADTADTQQGGGDKEIRDYNSLIFGSEIPKSPQAVNICKLEFNFILSIYQIHLLLSLKEVDLAKKKLDSCQITFHNFTKLIKDGRDDKGNFIGRFNPSISSFIETHANILFSFAKAYYAYQNQSYAESMKLLNTIEILTFLDQEILAYTAFQLNNLGCCHLRMKKYNLAAYYLSKALNIIQKLSKETTGETKKYDRLLNLNAIQHYPVILYNYALATLQMGKNEEAAEAYSSLAEFWPDNAKVWYRTALCHLNKAQEILADNQSQRKNGIYQALLDVPNYAQLVDEEKSEQSKTRKTEDVEHKENPYYTRYVLTSRENTLQKIEEEGGNVTGAPKFVNPNPDLNKGNEGTPSSLTDKELKMHLEKAAKCFRNAVLIIKKKKAKLQKEQPVNISMSSRDAGESEETKATEAEGIEAEEDKGKNIQLKPIRNLKDYQDILQSSLVHLAYTSLSLGEINNTINYAKECLELPSITDETKYICLMYLVEAYCFLGNQKDALNQMNSANVTQTILTVARNALGINSAFFTKGLSSKVVIYTNLATAHILNGNLTGAQNAINIALSNIDLNVAQIPMSLLNLMIYLNLKLDKPETALQILKRRRLLNSGNNKFLLRIVKWMS